MMNDPDSCYSSQLKDAVTIIDVSVDSVIARTSSTSRTVRDEHSLRSALQAFRQDDSKRCQMISICQRTSWRPLQITRPMMAAIKEICRLGAAFDRLPTCFYHRNADYENTYCVPWSHTVSGSVHEVIYSIRYPELKESDQKYIIRQTGICHSLDSETGKSIYILFEPCSGSKLSQTIQMLIDHEAETMLQNPFWLHNLLVYTYMPGWRKYMLHIEKPFLGLANKTQAIYAQDPSIAENDDLTTIFGQRNKFLQVPVILAHFQEVTKGLSLLVESLPSTSESISQEKKQLFLRDLDNTGRETASYLRIAEYWKERTQSTIQLLSNTLMLRERIEAKEQNTNMMDQNANMIRLNKSAVFITAMTLLYLPSSWLATFFGMNFFDLDTESHRIVSSPMIWIYIAASVLLTGATFVLYYFLLKSDGKFFDRVAPNRSVPMRFQTGFAGITRRLTRTFTFSDHEMSASPQHSQHSRQASSSDSVV